LDTYVGPVSNMPFTGQHSLGEFDMLFNILEIFLI
jgi:hypothetical protein